MKKIKMISAKGVNFTLEISLCVSFRSVLGIQSWGSNIEFTRWLLNTIQQWEQILWVHTTLWTNLTNIVLSTSQIQKGTRCDSIYIKFKNRQNSSMVLEVRKVVAPGGRNDRREPEGEAGHTQFLDLSAEYMSVFSFWKFIDLVVSILFLCVCQYRVFKKSILCHSYLSFL